VINPRTLSLVGIAVLLIGLALFTPARTAVAATVEVTGTLPGNTTWTSENVYVINGDLYVPANIKLTIQAGTVVKLKGRGSIFVRGILDASGTAGSPVVFTSFQDDTYGGDTDGDGAATPPQRGDWGSVQFDDTSDDVASIVQHTILRYGGLERLGCCDDSLRGGITLSNAQPTLANLTFESNLINGVGIPGGTKAPSATVSGETWGNSGMVYVVLGDLGIDPGFTLNISPGMIVKFAGGRVSLFVRGALAARGTAAAPITFTSLNDDAIGGDTDSDGTQGPPAQKDWGFIQFEDSSSDAASFVEHATFRYSGLERFGCCDDTLRGAINLANAQPTLANLVFSGNYLNGVGIVGGTKAPTATVTGETWANTGMVYVLLGDVVVEPGFKLTIAPGMIIKAGGRTSIFVHGALDARGTAIAPIVFTSVNDDADGGDTDGDGTATPPQKDDWGYIQYEDTSDDATSFVEHATFRFSGLERFGCCDDTRRAALTLVNAQPTLANLTFASNHIGAVGVAGGTRTADERWANPGVVYVVLWDVVIDPAVKLTIVPGMIVKFESRTSLFVRGSIDARGTAAAPITFTSLQDDSAGGDSDNDGALTPPQKYNWGWVQLGDSSDDGASFIEYATFRYSGLERFGCCDDPTSAALTLVNAQPTLANLTFATNYVSAVGIAGGARTANETWSSTTVTYAVIGDVTVPQGFSLSVSPGVVVKFASRTGIFVSGAFAARGTASAPITFTSLQDDSVGGDSDADGAATPPNPQDWGWIQFEDVSNDAASGIEEAVIRYAGLERFGCCDDPRAAALVLKKAAPRIARTLLTDNYRGIDLVGGALPQLACNDILGNQSLGISNDTPSVVVGATGHWWGSPAGPTHPSNPDGNGQAVGNGITFAPWATQSCLAVAPPPDQLALTVAELRDSLSGTATTVDGNHVTALVDLVNRGSQPIQLTVQLLDTYPASPVALATVSTTVPAGQTERLTLSFRVERMAWNAAGDRTAQRPLVARLQTSDGVVVSSPAVELQVSPRPVMLVHGYNDDETGWSDYVDPKNPNSTRLLARSGLTGVAPTFDTGRKGPLVLTKTIDQNAQLLKTAITELKSLYKAEQIDIVAHSMGGLISRRYIARYMSSTADVGRLIMLGTPNAGTRSATAAILSSAVAGQWLDGIFPVRYPAIVELTQSSARLFNLTNSERRGVGFYAVAGNYFCPRNGIQAANPLEEDPDDIAVARSSVFAIRLDGRWTYPGPASPGCGGDHRAMRSSSSESGGSIFELYVAPILRRVGPTNAPEQIAQLEQAETESPADPLQYTTVQTATVRAGTPVTLSQAVEAGGPATFIVVGEPAQVTVRLRSPSGAEYTPASLSGAEYAQLTDGFVPMTIYKVPSPEAGTWQILVDATAQAPVNGVIVAALGAMENAIQLTVAVGDPAAGQAGLIKATLRNGAAPIPGAALSAVVQPPSGGKLILTLRDDGASGDGAAGDGVYAATVSAQADGVYAAVVTATGTVGGASFTRSSVWSAELVSGRLYLPLLRR